MSHVSKLGLRVKDLDCLEETLAQDCPELELRRNKKTHAWWGTFVGDSTPPLFRDPKDYGKCEHAIGFKGVTPHNGHDGKAWEIGLVPAIDEETGQRVEGYDMLCDTYSAGRVFAQKIDAVKQGYAVRVAAKRSMEQLARHGWNQVKETLPGGTIRLRLQHR